MKTVNNIRSEFLNFFKDKGHEQVSSSSLVPHNDPTLMFVAAGMVQFKDVFTGKEVRPYNRASTAQKCLRAGGKHNDLDNVGYTARHHTFFEMLGNFSFGDYFKEDAISMAWELVTQNFGLPPEKLLVTVHSTDEEAAVIWKKVTGLTDEKIIRIPTDDNFWRMGDTGPCGPCTEIFYDHGPEIWGGPPGSAEEDGDRFIEIWNLVFMQFEQHADGTRSELPRPCVDTGMGLERMAAILQDVHSNYEIDLFERIIDHVAELTRVSKEGDQAASHRVIADHLRACAFLLADGVMPSNEGRGYVLRRIMRRGMRHVHLLGASEPLMHKLMPTLLSLMGEAYPELKRAETMITQNLELEETRFKKTLDRGLAMLEEEVQKVGNDKILPGEVAFKLYDTYGFPVDLTADALRAQNITVDMAGFEAQMEAQKAKARAAWSGSGEQASEKLWFDLEQAFGATEFLGYDREESEAQILALIQNGEVIQKAGKGQLLQILTNQTPFYAESGGQVGDTGIILSERGTRIRVMDTHKKLGKLTLHEGEIEHGEIEVGENLKMHVDPERRQNIRVHHSVTHLLHEALREVVGDHVAQKGSLQHDTRTRFDISHHAQITSEQMQAIEQIINSEIRANTRVDTRIMPLEEAMQSGAQALFGEKYGEQVRVVSMGTQAPGANKKYSVELCGGTHVERTGEIGLFKVIGESAVSAGVRRIEGVAGAAALDYLNHQDEIVYETSAVLRASPAEVPARVKTLQEERRKLENQVADLRRQLASGGSAGGANDDIKEINGVKFLAKVLSDFPAKDLKPMADDLKKKIGSGVVALIALNEGKASIVVAVTPDLTAQLSAVDLVKIGAEALGGKGGGGRPDLAQAGGPDATAANDAVKSIETTMGV